MDWKQRFMQLETTIPALVASFFGFVLFAPQHFNQWPIIQDLAAYFFAGGLAVLGINAVSRPTKGK